VCFCLGPDVHHVCIAAVIKVIQSCHRSWSGQLRRAWLVRIVAWTELCLNAPVTSVADSTPLWFWRS
jgi:hypothetical protein